MTADQLRNAIRAEPFRPFTIHAADQKPVYVKHPRRIFVTQGGRTAYVATGGENVEIIDVPLVTRLTPGRSKGPRRPRPRRH